jgi:hypothetical protein
VGVGRHSHEGEFHTGFAEIPLDYVSNIVDVQVREGDILEESSSGGGGSRGFR